MLNALALLMFVGYGVIGLIVIGVIWCLLPSRIHKKIIEGFDIND